MGKRGKKPVKVSNERAIVSKAVAADQARPLRGEWRGWLGESRGSNGFTNDSGEACYRNSALQLVLHLPELLKWLKDYHKPDQCTVSNKNRCVACQLRKLALRYWRNATNRELTANFKQFNGACARPLAHDGTASEGWDREGQQDAMEYMTWLVDAITESVPEDKRNILNGLFQLRTADTYKCRSCDRSSMSRSTDRSFTVYLNDPTDHGQLEEYISNCMASEVPEGYRCDGCGGRDTTKKTPRLLKPPVLLLVLLNRIQSDGQNAQKIVDHVGIGEKLNLTNYITDSRWQPLRYELKAAVHHQHAAGRVNKKTGAVTFSVNSGHYKAVVQAPNSLWREVEDETVTENSGLASAVDPRGPNWTPYLLVYKMLPPQAISISSGESAGAGNAQVGDKRKRDDPFVGTGEPRSKIQQTDGPASPPPSGSGRNKGRQRAAVQGRRSRDGDLRVQMLRKLHTRDLGAFQRTAQQSFQRKVTKPAIRGKNSRPRPIRDRKGRPRLETDWDELNGVEKTSIGDSNSSDRMSWSPTDDFRKSLKPQGYDEGPFVMPARGMIMSCFRERRRRGFSPDSPDRMTWSPTPMLPADEQWNQANMIDPAAGPKGPFVDAATLAKLYGSSTDINPVGDWDGLFGDQATLALARERLKRKPKHVFVPKDDVHAPSRFVVDPTANIPLDPQKVTAFRKAGFSNPEGLYRRIVADGAVKSRHPAVSGDRDRGGPARNRSNGVEPRLYPALARVGRQLRGEREELKELRKPKEPKEPKGAWTGQSMPNGEPITRAAAAAAAPVRRMEADRHIPGAGQLFYPDLASIERERSEARFLSRLKGRYKQSEKERLLALFRQ